MIKGLIVLESSYWNQWPIKTMEHVIIQQIQRLSLWNLHTIKRLISGVLLLPWILYNIKKKIRRQSMINSKHNTVFDQLFQVYVHQGFFYGLWNTIGRTVLEMASITSVVIYFAKLILNCIPIAQICICLYFNKRNCLVFPQHFLLSPYYNFLDILFNGTLIFSI